MRKIAIALALTIGLAPVVAGCNFTTFQAAFQADIGKVEAQIATFIAKVKANAPVVLADAQQAVSLVCSIVPQVQQQLSDFTTSIQNPSSKVQTALSQANNAAIAAVAGCATYTAQVNSSAPPTLAQAINFGVGIWNSYQSAKAALQVATSATAGG
jgi:predicted ATP-binding protein involved in virulence